MEVEIWETGVGEENFDPGCWLDGLGDPVLGLTDPWGVFRPELSDPSPCIG